MHGTGLWCYGRAIARIRHIGTRVCLALVLLAGCPTLALSALSTRVRIHGPRQARAGQPVTLHVSGYAGRGSRTLFVQLDNRPCAWTERAEEQRPYLPPPVQRRVSGTFVANLTVKRSVPGTHLACAYLVRRRTGFTVARARWRYVTRRPGPGRRPAAAG